MNLVLQYIIIFFVLFGCIYLAVKYFGSVSKGKGCERCKLKDSCGRKDKDKNDASKGCGCH